MSPVDKQWNVEQSFVSVDGDLNGSSINASMSGSIACGGSLAVAGKTTISGDLLISIPSSDTEDMGRLWNDNGVLRVSSIDRFYNEGTIDYIDCTAGGAYIEGLTQGYIEFEIDDPEWRATTNYLRVSSSTFPDGLYFLQMDDEYDSIQFHNGTNFSLKYKRPTGLAVIRLSFTATSNTLTINGNPVDVEYIEGSSSTGMELPSTITEVQFSERMVGFCNNLKVHDGATIVLDYSSSVNGATYTESVNNAHGVYVELGFPDLASTVERVGFNDVPYWTLNRYVAPTEDSPFDGLDIDLTKTPLDSERAYLLNQGSPLIFENDPFNTSPSWADISIENLRRNPNCWYHSKAMTCFSVLSRYHGFAGHVTALSPRHGIINEHIRNDFGSSQDVWFMDMDDNYQKVNYIDHENIAGTDVTILLFDNTLTVDIDYATFLTDADSNAYNSRGARSCGPSKEGIFSIERESQMCASGLPFPMDEQPEYEWSRFSNGHNNATNRSGDSSSPTFWYHGSVLYLFQTALFQSGFPYDGSASNSSCINNPEDRGYNNPTFKASIKTAMDALDDRNGGLTHYNLVEVPI
jgi:hypothetical protein